MNFIIRWFVIVFVGGLSSMLALTSVQGFIWCVQMYKFTKL